MRARIPIVLACAALLAVACQDTPTDPGDTSAAAAPELNFMNGPVMAGVVTRGDASFNGIFDYTRDETEKAGEPWMVWMGTGIDDDPPRCGGSGPETTWVSQTIEAPGARDAILLEMNKDMGVTVFSFYEFFGNYMSAPTGVDPAWYAFCETTPIAGGTAHGIANTTPAGEGFGINGSIDYMGETYRLKWMGKWLGQEGILRRSMRVW